MKKAFIIATLLSVTGHLFAQNKIIFVVKDSMTSEKLAGVSVIVRSIEHGFTTDTSGAGRFNKNSRWLIQYTILEYWLYN